MSEEVQPQEQNLDEKIKFNEEEKKEDKTKWRIVEREIVDNSRDVITNETLEKFIGILKNHLDNLNDLVFSFPTDNSHFPFRCKISKDMFMQIMTYLKKTDLHKAISYVLFLSERFMTDEEKKEYLEEEQRKKEEEEQKKKEEEMKIEQQKNDEEPKDNEENQEN